MKGRLPVLGGPVSCIDGFLAGQTPALPGVPTSNGGPEQVHHEHAGPRPREAVQQSDEADEGRVVRERRWCTAVISPYGCYREGSRKVAPLAAYRWGGLK